MAKTTARKAATKSVKAAAKTKTVPYDVAEQLRTPEEMAAYLDAWLAEAPDDAAGIARALGDIARSRAPRAWRRWHATQASAEKACTAR